MYFGARPDNYLCTNKKDFKISPKFNVEVSEEMLRRGKYDPFFLDPVENDPLRLS